MWELLFDTADDNAPPVTHAGGGKYELKSHALAVFRTRPETSPAAQATALGRAAKGD